jgi:hypothetical protein
MSVISPDVGARGDVKLQATLRFAVGITAAFVVSEMMQWSPSFIAPMLTTVLLSNIPIRPPLKMALGLVIVMTVTSVFAFVIASLLHDTPTILFGLIGLCVFLAFYVMLSGKPALPPLLLLICLATIPVLVMVAPKQAGAMPVALVRGMAVALVTIWLVYLPWPLTAPPKPAPAGAPIKDARVAMALAGVAVVMPLMLVYLLFGLADVLPVMIATVMLVANFDLNRGRAQALGMIVGNFAGGLLGLLLHTLLLALPTLPFLAGMLFLVMLGFGQRIIAGGPLAGVAVLTCNATLFILSSAISSDSASLSLWLVRVFQFSLAGAFSVGMMSLVWYRATHTPPAKHSPDRR